MYMGSTAKQTAVLTALDARPGYWMTEASDIANATDLSERGALFVLYHLSDEGVVEYTEIGWQRKDRN